jgi:hypothetical protein
MGSQPLGSGVTVEWDDAKHNKTKNNVPKVWDGGRYKSYKKDDLKSANDDFTPTRVVLDLKLNFGNDRVSEVTLADVHLKIPYSGVQPTFGWWNGNKWIAFDRVTYAKNVADIILPVSWPTDPPIGAYP